jgi:Uncharacterized conserved protein
MLTSDLAISFRRGDKIFPFLIKNGAEGFLRDAENLIEIFEEAEGKTRGALEAELEEYVGTGTDYRILRGMIKLLTDRCEFETHAPADPLEIRQKVFLEARKLHPVLPDSEARKTILESAADEFDTDADSLFSGLYADLAAQQKLISFKPIEAEDLLNLYNLSQAQAIFYRCVEMKIRVAPSSAQEYRAIFGWIKHFGLIHSVVGNAANGYEITLTGAASLFHRSQKYGVRMAVFLPVLLLCKNWKMRAEINDKRGTLFYELSSEQTELISNRFDEPEYVNPDLEKLLKNWEKLGSDWRLKENRKVIDLGRTAFIPDLVIISPDAREVYLDVLGFWTPKSLQKRLEEFSSAGYKKFIIAASHELRGSREEPLWESPNVIFYKTKIEPRVLIEMAEKLLYVMQN